MADTLDLSTYARPPRMDVPTAVAVGIALLAAPAPQVTPSITKSRTRLRTSVLGLQTAWAQRDKQRAESEPLDPRTADLRVDTVWGAAFGIVDALASLPAAASERFALAAKVRDSLFFDGKAFLTLPYPAEWAESQKRLDRIDNEGLAPDLEKLVGADVVTELREAHLAYGKAVEKIMQGAGEVEAVLVRAPLQAVAEAITDYCVKVLATVEPDEPETAAAARKALKAIDVVRARAVRRTPATGDAPDLPPADPGTPVPVV
jgi:hypothetical protein